MRWKGWTGIALLMVGALLLFGAGPLAAASAETADGAAGSEAEQWKMHRRARGRGWGEGPAAGLFISASDLDELVKSLADRTGLSEEELRKEIEDAGRTVPKRRGGKGWGRGWHHHGRHYHHRWHHHHRHHRHHDHHWMDPDMAPRHFRRHRGAGPDEFPMHRGMGPGGMRGERFRRGVGWDGPGRPSMGPWWMWDADDWGERISPEQMTPQLEEALERLKAAGSEAQAAVTDMIRSWGAAMEARLDAMAAWLEAARESSAISEERYERMKARYEAMREWHERIDRKSVV